MEYDTRRLPLEMERLNTSADIFLRYRVDEYGMGSDPRVQRLLDREAIQELRAEYCYRYDERDREGFLELFTDDAVVTIDDEARYEDRAGIEALYDESVDSGRFWAHMVHNPVITVEGDTGHGKWYFEVPTTFESGEAGWTQGIYDEDYRRVEDGWRFTEIRATTHYRVEYADGWTDQV